MNPIKRNFFNHEDFSCQNWRDLNDVCPFAKPMGDTVKIPKFNCERDQQKWIWFAYTQGVDAAKMLETLLPKNRREMARYGVNINKINFLRQLVSVHETAHLVCWQPIEDIGWLLDNIKWSVSLVVDIHKGRNIKFWKRLEFIIRDKHQLIIELLQDWQKEEEVIKKEMHSRTHPIPQPMVCLYCSKSGDPDLLIKLTQAFQRGFDREFLHFLVFVLDLED